MTHWFLDAENVSLQKDISSSAPDGRGRKFNVGNELVCEAKAEGNRHSDVRAAAQR